MKLEILTFVVSASLLVVSSGCGTAPGPASQSSASLSSGTATNIDASRYKLAEEPDGAVGVIVARESTADGDPLVLVGRVGGSDQPWVEGRAAFTLLDASMNLVAQGEDTAEGEICTGDCCATELLHCTTLVKVVNAQGQLVKMDSRELLGLKEADMVVVQGTVKKDENGNFVMLASGVYNRNE